MRRIYAKNVEAPILTALQSEIERMTQLQLQLETLLNRGWVLEEIPKEKWGVLYRFLKSICRIFFVELNVPRRRKALSQQEVSEFSCELERIIQLKELLKQEYNELKSLPELHIAPANISESERGYPEDWETISLEYRRKIRFICEECGIFAPDGHVHHILPVSQGGGSSEDNLQFLCKSCHAMHHPYMRED